MKTHKLFDLPLGSRFRYLLDRKRVYVLLDDAYNGKIARAPDGPAIIGRQTTYSAASTREAFESVIVEFVPVQEVPCAD